MSHKKSEMLQQASILSSASRLTEYTLQLRKYLISSVLLEKAFLSSLPLFLEGL
jgi:hypothetical protein